MGLEDLEKIAGREVAAVHTLTRHIHPNEPRVLLKKISDAQTEATNNDPSPPWCIPIPSRVFGPFLLLTMSTSAPLSLAVWIRRSMGILSSPEVELQELHFLPLNLWSSSRKTGQDPLPETWAVFFSPLSVQFRHFGGALHSLALCVKSLHLQQASFLLRWVQPHSLTFPSWSWLETSAFASWITTVLTPPKRVWSLQCPSRSGLHNAPASAATTSSFSTVSSRSLLSRDLFETSVSISALTSTAQSSAFWNAEMAPPFLRTRRTSSFLVLWIERTSSPESSGLTLAFISFKMTA